MGLARFTLASTDFVMAFTMFLFTFAIYTVYSFLYCTYYNSLLQTLTLISGSMTLLFLNFTYLRCAFMKLYYNCCYFHYKTLTLECVQLEWRYESTKIRILVSLTWAVRVRGARKHTHLSLSQCVQNSARPPPTLAPSAAASRAVPVQVCSSPSSARSSEAHDSPGFANVPHPHYANVAVFARHWRELVVVTEHRAQSTRYITSFRFALATAYLYMYMHISFPFHVELLCFHRVVLVL